MVKTNRSSASRTPARTSKPSAKVRASKRKSQRLDVHQQKLDRVSAEIASIVLKNKALFQRLIANQERLRGFSKGVIRVQEEERARISRELHDGIGQILTALRINIESLFPEIENLLTPASREKLLEVKKHAEQAVEDVRELSRLLRPRMLDDLGLLPTLRWYVRTFSERTGIHVTFDNKESTDSLDPDIESMLFRITQEALTNIVKHSQSKSAIVRLDCQKKSIQLEIQDYGIGLKTNQPTQSEFTKGSGIPGIRDRVSLWGGEFSIRSQAGKGTILRIMIPIETSGKSRKTRRG